MTQQLLIPLQLNEVLIFTDSQRECRHVFFYVRLEQALTQLIIHTITVTLSSYNTWQDNNTTPAQHYTT